MVAPIGTVMLGWLQWKWCFVCMHHMYITYVLHVYHMCIACVLHLYCMCIACASFTAMCVCTIDIHGQALIVAPNWNCLVVGIMFCCSCVLLAAICVCTVDSVCMLQLKLSGYIEMLLQQAVMGMASPLHVCYVYTNHFSEEAGCALELHFDQNSSQYQALQGQLCIHYSLWCVCFIPISARDNNNTSISSSVTKVHLNLLTTNNCSSATFSHTGNTFGATLHNSRPSATKAKATNSPLEADAKYVPA